jgi:hypothetical protein
MDPIHLGVRDDGDGESGMRSRQDESDPITGTGKVMGGSVETPGEEAESGGVSRLEEGRRVFGHAHGRELRLPDWCYAGESTPLSVHPPAPSIYPVSVRLSACAEMLYLSENS